MVLEDGETLKADAIILANAHQAQALGVNRPLGISAGQVSVLQSPAALAAIVCHKGYTIDTGTAWSSGATYDRHDMSGAVTNENHVANMHELQQAMPQMPPLVITGGRTSLRATTPSRLPYIGHVAPGIYASVGHGSRGMISAPLAAELIAAQLCNEPWPVSDALATLLSPHA